MAQSTKKQPNRRDVFRRTIVRLVKNVASGLIDLTALPLETRYKGVRLMKKGEFRKIFSRLLYEGEIEVLDKNKYKLTALGVVRTLPEIKKELVQDGKVRILVFDIPETKRSVRDKFRRHIRTLGFKKHQQSVWVSEYDCENWMLKVIDYHKVGDYVSLYIGNHIW